MYSNLPVLIGLIAATIAAIPACFLFTKSDIHDHGPGLKGKLIGVRSDILNLYFNATGVWKNPRILLKPALGPTVVFTTVVYGLDLTVHYLFYFTRIDTLVLFLTATVFNAVFIQLLAATLRGNKWIFSIISCALLNLAWNLKSIIHRGLFAPTLIQTAIYIAVSVFTNRILASKLQLGGDPAEIEKLKAKNWPHTFRSEKALVFLLCLRHFVLFYIESDYNSYDVETYLCQTLLYTANIMVAFGLGVTLLKSLNRMSMFENPVESISNIAIRSQFVGIAFHMLPQLLDMVIPARQFWYFWELSYARPHEVLLYTSAYTVLLYIIGGTRLVVNITRSEPLRTRIRGVV